MEKHELLLQENWDPKAGGRAIFISWKIFRGTCPLPIPVRAENPSSNIASREAFRLLGSEGRWVASFQRKARQAESFPADLFQTQSIARGLVYLGEKGWPAVFENERA
jgi:hypothetical protein